jgi:hypothetical protein
MAFIGLLLIALGNMLVFMPMAMLRRLLERHKSSREAAKGDHGGASRASSV